MPQGDDEAAFLGNGDDPVRPQDAFLRMPPPHQSLAPDQRAGAEVHTRLEVKLELTPV